MGSISLNGSHTLDVSTIAGQVGCSLFKAGQPVFTTTIFVRPNASTWFGGLFLQLQAAGVRAEDLEGHTTNIQNTLEKAFEEVWPHQR